MSFKKKQDQLLKTKEEFEEKLKSGLSRQQSLHLTY